MKLTFLALALGAALVAADSDPAQGVPDCAKPCVTEYTSGNKIAGCQPLDIGCVCKNKDFIEGVSCCLEQKCDKAGQTTAIQYAHQICSAEGVSVPNHLVCNKNVSPSGSSSSSSSSSKSPSSTGSAAGTSTGTKSSSSTSTSAASAATSTGAAAAQGMISSGGVLGAVMAMLAAL